MRPMTLPSITVRLTVILILSAGFNRAGAGETLNEITSRLGVETSEAYAASPFSALSRDYFSRFARDPEARPLDGEVAIEAGWKIVLPVSAPPLAGLMARDFADFMNRRMGVDLKIEEGIAHEKAIEFAIHPADGSMTPESFTIAVKPGRISVEGADEAGLRDGVVHLVDMIGFRQAPFIEVGSQTFKPRLKVRLGSIPMTGSYRELVFSGFNAVLCGGGSLFGLSTSDAIPELAARREPGAIAAQGKAGDEPRRYGLKTYAFLNTRQKFPKDDPVFVAHPEIRGALTWKADGEYVLCTSHPLVQQYLKESVRGIFKSDPKLDGLVLINGGEGFYHCFMRAFGAKKGHTNCARCEPLGAETVVANLCNMLADAAREVSPQAEVIVWPYSAEHVWSADKTQSAFIKKLKPGVAILTEIEKDEYVEKPEGVRKHLWDYSIDLIGPGARAKKQIEDAKAAGISIYLKSEPEAAFEAPRLPHIPCMDRWIDRAEALASCGADGAWVFPAFRGHYGTSASETGKFVWWEPKPEKETLLLKFAARIAGEKAAPDLRAAWRSVSEAIEFSPEIPSYYNGPYYLGPAHPMCADPKAALPDVFYGYYLFMAEMTDAEGVEKRPTFVTKPTGNIPVFAKYYRRMETLLGDAEQRMTRARWVVPERNRLTFDAEDSAIRWFHATTRTEANFYEASMLRDRLLELAEKPKLSAEESTEARDKSKAWISILKDERANAEAALPLVRADVRLDFHYGGDHTFPHTEEMIVAKLDILNREIEEFVPGIARRCGIEPE